METIPNSNVQLLRNREYASALREALRMRKAGTITPAIDEQLGLFIYNIANCEISSMIVKKKLFRDQANDPDFLSDVVAGVAKYIDRVNTDMDPPAIFAYLRMAAHNAITDIQKKMSRGKRQHEDVELGDAKLVANFYGEATGTMAWSSDLDDISEKFN